MDFITSLIPSLSPLSILIICSVVIFMLYSRLRHPSHYPPMPIRPHPILGHLTSLNKNILQTYDIWRKSVGDIFSLYFGVKLYVVLNSHKLIKEAFVKYADRFAERGRPPSTYIRQDRCSGIISNDGPSWRAQRSTSTSILRDFGMGKNWLGERISEEVENYLKELSILGEKPTEIRPLTNMAVSNIICTIVIGRRFEYNDSFFLDYIEHMNELVLLGPRMFVLAAFPFIKYLPLPGDPFTIKKYRQLDRYLVETSKKFIERSKEKNDGNNFILAYHDAMEKRIESGHSAFLNEKQLPRIVIDLVLGGSETSSTTIMWAYAFAINYPKIQEKVYNEIVTVVGTERLPSLHDRPKLNYLNAFILETQRLGSIVPLSFPHYCSEETQIGDYTIPKGAYVIPNLDAVLKEETTWGDPLVFRPERFLDNDGNLVVPEEFVVFSLGRRSCMGESLAKMELFLFLSAIFQRFHICPEDPNNLPLLKPVFGTTCAPVEFNIVFKERSI